MDVVIDRDAAARLGVNTTAIDNALNNAYSQRQISTIYTQRNQYKVVLEIDPKLQTDPSLLDRIYVGATGGKQVPLSAVAHFVRDTAPLAVRHQGQFPAATLSFNRRRACRSGTPRPRCEKAARELRMPEDVRTEFAGNARFLQQSLATQPLLIARGADLDLHRAGRAVREPAASADHHLHPAIGRDRRAARTADHRHDLSIMGMIGIILLMGIVKKNAIMLVDFALEAERQRGLPPEQAIHEACLERFRPIMMTTLAALLGAVPLALAFGTGAELRRPLGISIIGGLIVSQMLTLYTTPVVYLALERLAGKRPPIVVPADRQALRRLCAGPWLCRLCAVLTSARCEKACGKLPDPRCTRVVFLGEQADIVAERQQALEQRARLALRPCRIDCRPARSCRRGTRPRPAAGRRRDLAVSIAHDKAVTDQIALDRRDRAAHARIVGGRKPMSGISSRLASSCSRAIELHEAAEFRVEAVAADVGVDAARSARQCVERALRSSKSSAPRTRGQTQPRPSPWNG